MDTAPSHRPVGTDASLNAERLDSWKEIATYLKRSVRTVHRWETEEGLPVHRQLHRDLGSVYAYKRELDAWSCARSVHAAPRDATDLPSSATPYRMIVTATVVASVVLLGAIAYLAPPSSRSTRSGGGARGGPRTHLDVRRIASLAKSSPDGRMVAFVSDAGGTPQVWIKNISTGEPIQITYGELPAVRPRWSPEGNRLIFSRRGGGIWSVPALGGEPRQIVKEGLNADVSPDGQRLAFERAGRLFIAGIDGSGASELPRLPRRLIEHFGDSWPTFYRMATPSRSSSANRAATATTGSSRRTEVSLAESDQIFRKVVRRPGRQTGRRSSSPRHDRAA